MKRFAKYILLIIIFLLGIFVYIEYRFNQIKQPPIVANYEAKIWSHRGVHQYFPENTIAAYQLAKDQNFKGIELDVYFDKTYGLVISHDLPPIVVNESTLLLEEVIAKFGNTFSYWVDLKNLSTQNHKAVLNSFQQIIYRYPSIEQKIFIESGNGRALRKLANQNLNCVYWVQYSKRQPKQFLKLLYIKALIGHSNFKGISTHFRYIDNHFEEEFKQLNWYVFTLNGKKRIKKLSDLENVAAILTDFEGEDIFIDE